MTSSIGTHEVCPAHIIDYCCQILLKFVAKPKRCDLSLQRLSCIAPPPTQCHSYDGDDNSAGIFWDVRISNYELKFTVPPQSTAAIEAWLNASCCPDDAHPTNTVSSIYYDTPDWRHLREKANGDYLKSKLRLRWYSRESSQSEGKISDPRCAYAELIPSSIEGDSFRGFPNGKKSESMRRTDTEVRHGQSGCVTGRF